MRIALDALGSDRHPEVEVQGAVAALREVPGDFEIVFVGDRATIEPALAQADAGEVAARISIVHATERIEAGEPPASAVRRKRDSSIVVGLNLQKQGEADAFVSAGSTGAVMAASLLMLRPLPGVDRPTVATILPTAGDPIVMVDAGANVDSKPYHLVDWARLGAIYAEDVLRRDRPRVGLLNIGEEPEKGNELAVEAYRLLENAGLNFVGNVEGRDIVTGACDVLVTDGFAGNVLLKFYESIASFMVKLIRKELAMQDADVHLDRVFSLLDYTEYGGAPLLGVDGISIICHGGSPPRAIKGALRVAAQAYDTGMVADMKATLSAAAEAAPARPAATGTAGGSA
ncbi:MAG TPA: phosphate acyltransferase PlsX [Longimicrobiales bacterium]|nr:phosphate acyltransferase PlsX [Longimicrobiales bacterium]